MHFINKYSYEARIILDLLIKNIYFLHFQTTPSLSLSLSLSNYAHTNQISFFTPLSTYL